MAVASGWHLLQVRTEAKGRRSETGVVDRMGCINPHRCRKEPLTHRLRRWKQIGSHDEQKGMWSADLKRRILWARKRVSRLWGMRLLMLNECIHEEVGYQGGELVDSPRLGGMVCCCDGKESEALSEV